jgi:hypothetical protein
MMNFLKEKKKWMVAQLIAIGAIHAQSCASSCEPCCVPHELLQCPTIAGYSAPARIDTQCSWDVSVDASFIYWQPLQENMNPAAWHLPYAPTNGNNQFNDVNLDFKYIPGFKIGMGMSFDYDHWETSLEYTRLHGTFRRSATLSNASALSGNGYLTWWGNSFETTNIILNINAFKAEWRLNMDFLDIDLARSYYVGTQLTFRPSIGMRVAWIDQHRKATYSNVINSNYSLQDKASSDSWGIGPRFALGTNWMIGKGFRFFGNSYLDLLFTRYKESQTDLGNNNGSALNTYVKGDHINQLRPHIDLEWGLGWGSYFNCHNYHLDFSASYGYQIFWHQNMFAYTLPGKTSPGSLYVHGLTLTAKLDF